MSWLKSHWRWASLNIAALSILIFTTTQGSLNWDANKFDPELESGKWAIRFLLICLAMTPLNLYFGWQSVIKLRKPAGLWAFAFAASHVLFYISDAGWDWFNWFPQFIIVNGNLDWLRFAQSLVFIPLGLLGLTILTALALTSNRFAMKRLGKNWKRLHRLVYVAGIAVATHALIATAMSKKLTVRDPQSAYELKIYLAVLAALLIIRIPLVRRLLKAIALPLRARRPIAPTIIPINVPHNPPALPPQIFADTQIPARELQLAHEDDISEPTDLPLAR
jgi:sulfoxide reductase heme-binding subunit YedZ